MTRTRFLHRLLMMLTATLALYLSGCAKDLPVFTPPQQRSEAANERPWPSNHYVVLAYHAIQDDVADQTYLGIRTDQLLAQLQWLKKNNYHAVSVDQILAAQKGGTPLPPRAVLLSFDDGYKDFYTRVIPLLRSFQWPAVLAPVGDWIRTPDTQPVIFGDQPAPRQMFLNERELQQAAKSPWVEIGAHTYNLHKGTVSNPQGNLMPSVANHLYLEKEKRYETSEEFKQRVRSDVRAITKMVTENSGKRPRVWVWPYGRGSGEAIQIIKEEGYELFLSLEEGLSNTRRSDNVPRVLMSGRDSIEGASGLIVSQLEKTRMRVAHVDLDYVYDTDPEQQARNLDQLVQRMSDLRVNTVFLQAFSDPKGDGLVNEVYFPNTVLPMRADLFNRVAWQLTSRADVRVYAWMPVLSLNLDSTYPRVSKWDPQSGNVAVDPRQYQRLSPFNERNRLAIGKLYEDLARHASFSGLLFHDDALLSDFEDASPDALQAYAAQGLPSDIAAIRNDSAAMQRWTRYKSQSLIQFTQELAGKVRAIRGPFVQTARNIFAEPILRPESEAWFAQNLDDFLGTYDWTAPMAMPYMEGVPDAKAGRWLDQLVDRVAQRPDALDKTVFELQTRDWRQAHETGRGKAGSIDSATIAEWMRRLQMRGAKHYGYYPDDFTQDHPALKDIRPQMSTTWFPYP